MRCLVTFCWIGLGCGFCLPLAGGEKADDPAVLSLERIYGSSDFRSQGFSARWRPNGAHYMVWKQSQDVSDGRDLVEYHVTNDSQQTLIPAAALIPDGSSSPLPIDDYAFSEDDSLVLLYTNSKRVWRRNTRGDYWILDRSIRGLRKLGAASPPASLMFAKLSPDGSRVAYVQNNNLILEDLRGGAITPLTNDRSTEIINGTFDWVYEEEFGLRDGFRWSPDGRRIAFWQINTSGVRSFPLVNNTDGLYPKITQIKYPKVGEQNPASRIGVIEISTGTIKWLEIPGDPRNHYLARMQWAGNSSELLIQQLNRLQNSNRLLLVNVESDALSLIHCEQDDAWVDVHDELFWLADHQQCTWMSERDGWRHIYLASRDGKPLVQVTEGPFDVIQLLHVNEPDGWLTFLASPDNATQRYLYRVRIDGTDLQRLTPDKQPGSHRYHIASDGDWAIHRWSTFDQPTQVDLVSLPQHVSQRSLADNSALVTAVQKLNRAETEFLRIDVGNGVELDGWCIRPPRMEPDKKYPLLIYVYGEPAGQTVRDAWSRNHLWHWMLAQQGYVVMSFDNRGTPAPRGRDWRKCVYRQIGILAPQDQAAAVRRALQQFPYLDPQRVGVWGWSGGGSMSLNAIFKFPDLYHVAIAIAPVPNQRYYDTIYQERYMGLPGQNVNGFLQGSPIHFAQQLKGELLLIHGTGDDNCHYQTTELLINELIRHNKTFRMMAYPNRSHSIREGKNTTRHLRQLMTSFLYEHLPPGPRP